jgi:predicted permease
VGRRLERVGARFIAVPLVPRDPRESGAPDADAPRGGGSVAVAILQIARASARDRELGIRAALGAGRARIARQLLAESLVLGIAGCVLGVALSTVAARVAAAWLPVAIRVAALPDARALLFALIIALVAAVLVGIAPAVRGAAPDVLGLIQGRDRHAGGGRVRDGLVVLQVALSLVLVAGAVMFARSLLAARSIDAGFDDRGVLIVGVNLANHGYDAERGRPFLREAIDRVSALPGVAVASITRQVPFRGDWTSDLTEWPGADFAGGRDTLTVGLNVVAPGYFEGMGIPVLRGRAFAPSDDDGAAPVVVVNETFAREAFGDVDPLGLTVHMGDDRPPMLIAGIVRDAKYYRLDEEPWPQVYAPIQQFYLARVHFLIRTAGDAAALAGPVQQVLLGIDPDLAFEPVETLSDIRAGQVARFRTAAHLVGLTGFIALLLACAGLYGVMAWRVSRRTRELGLRMALGATRRALAADVLRNGLRLAAAGVLIGLAASLLLGRLIEGMLYGVHPRDPVSLLVAPVLLVAVAAASLLVPARRAMRVDPLIAMRAD